MKLLGSRLIFARDGASDYAPASTLPAFRLAAEMHALGVSLKVKHTSDGRLVVTQADNISEVSDGQGKLSELTLAELKKFDFSAKSRFNCGFTPIPTLDEVYALLSPLGLYVNVELEQSEREFIQAILDCASKYLMSERVFYSSSDKPSLAEILKLEPDAFVEYRRLPFPQSCVEESVKLGAKAIFMSSIMTVRHPEFVAEAHKQGLRVHTSASAKSVVIRRLCAAGVDLITTYSPDTALEIASELKTPSIAITTGLEPDGQSTPRISYITAVQQVGALPFIAQPGQDIETVLELCDGIILSGGGDIEPERFSSRAYDPDVLGGVSPERDEFELNLAKLAHERDIPILAICRGHQVLNVALGGDLHIDIPNHRQSAPRSECTHNVTLAPDSRIGNIFGRSELAVNSFHHQAINRLGDGLTVCAHSPDEIIEAVEDKSKHFCIGVQWHPENISEHYALFADFMKAVRERKYLPDRFPPNAEPK